MFCPRCGTQMPDDSAFCANCGNPLSAGQPPAQQPVYTTPRQVSYAAPPEKKKPFNWLALISILLLIALLGSTFALIGVSKGWFEIGSSNSSAKADEEEEEDEEREKEEKKKQDEEEEREETRTESESEDDRETEQNKYDAEETTSAVVQEQKDVVHYELPFLSFYMGKDLDATEDSGYYYRFSDSHMQIEFDLDHMDFYAEYGSIKEALMTFSDEGELGKYNGVSYIIVEDDDETQIGVIYVAGVSVYAVVAEVYDSDYVDEAIDYITSGEVHDTWNFDFGGLILPVDSGFEYDLPEVYEGYYSGEFGNGEFEVEVNSGPISEIEESLGVKITDSESFARAYVSFMETYGEQVEMDYVSGPAGKVWYVIYEDEVWAFYVRKDVGWFICAYGGGNMDEKIQFVTGAY